MVLDRIKRMLGLTPELTPYEREVLEREHRSVSNEIRQVEEALAKTPTSRSKKKLKPRIKQLLTKKDQLEARRKEIERQLGGPPKAGARSRRSKRSSR